MLDKYISALEERTTNLLFYLVVLVGVMLVLLIPASFVSAATTIGNNVSVGGTLGVTGVSTFTGATTHNGAVTLGDAITDVITITGRIGAHINPDTNDTYNLGSFDKAWQNIFASGTGYIDYVSSTAISASNVNFSGNAVITGTLTQNGAATFTYVSSTTGIDALNYVSSTNIFADGTLDVDGAVTLNGNVTLGNAVGDDITFSGRVVSNIIPDGDGIINLGRFSTTANPNGAWGNIYSSGTLYVGKHLTATTSIDFAKPCFRMVVDNGGALEELYYYPSLSSVGNAATSGWATSTVSCSGEI